MGGRMLFEDGRMFVDATHSVQSAQTLQIPTRLQLSGRARRRAQAQ